MSLFESAKEKFHVCGMDNLYNSYLLCKISFIRDMKVMVHGVTRKATRGIPPAVKQEEVKNRKKITRIPRYREV